LNNRTLLMYGVTGEKRPIFVESDAFLYNLGDPTYMDHRYMYPSHSTIRVLISHVMLLLMFE
jgi:hypothetical protein